MWIKGEAITYPNEIDKETRDFIEKHEFTKRDFTTVDPSNLYDLMNPNGVIRNTLLPWCEVPINIPHKDIYKEASHLLETGCFTAHRRKSSGWLSLTIHGLSSVHTNVPHDYGLPDSWEDDESTWTDIARFCPATVEWMKSEVRYEPFTRVRYMVVLPGGWLAPHTDTDTVPGLGATNVAINNPDGCKLVMENWGELPFTPGSAFKINTGYNHAVWNKSDTPRIHMIIDGDHSDYFKQKILEGYKKCVLTK